MIAVESAESTAFQSVMYWPRNCWMPSVMVCLPPVGASSSGNHRSFHTGIMVNTATVAMAGRINGNTM